MINRQKILFSFLLNSETSFQSDILKRLLFLLKQETLLREDKTFYDFVPFKGGPYSFSLEKEIGNLNNSGYLKFESTDIKLSSDRFADVLGLCNSLSNDVKYSIIRILRKYENLPLAMMDEVVVNNYPWYANHNSINNDTNHNPEKYSSIVYNIGYEGKSVENFFNILVRNNIRQIIDVRSNPISRKFGFSKRSFMNICDTLRFEYLHFPKLGIPGILRKNLNDNEDIEDLLRKYETEILSSQVSELLKVLDLVKKKPSALLCMEADAEFCHRSIISRRLSKISGYKVKQL